MYCFYNQKKKNPPKDVINKSEKKTCRQPVLEAPPGKSKHRPWSPRAPSTEPIREQLLSQTLGHWQGYEPPTTKL